MRESNLDYSQQRRSKPLLEECEICCDGKIHTAIAAVPCPACEPVRGSKVGVSMGQLEDLAAYKQRERAKAVGKIIRMVDADIEAGKMSDQELIEAVQRGHMDNMDITSTEFSLLDELCQRLRDRDRAGSSSSAGEAQN